MTANLQILVGNIHNQHRPENSVECFKRTSAMDFEQQDFFASTSHAHWHDFASMEGITLDSLQTQSSNCLIGETPKGSYERHRIMPHRAKAYSGSTSVDFQIRKGYLTTRERSDLMSS